MEAIAKRLERTPAGVILRARVLDLGVPGRGLIGLKALAKRLGYDAKAVIRAAKRAGVPLSYRRLPTTNIRSGKPRGVNYGFEDDDVDAIVAELRSSPNPNIITTTRHGEWGTGTKPPACLDCGRSDRKHSARGLCGACYKAREKYGRGFEDRPPIKRGTVNVRKRTDGVATVERWEPGEAGEAGDDGHGGGGHPGAGQGSRPGGEHRGPGERVRGPDGQGGGPRRGPCPNGQANDKQPSGRLDGGNIDPAPLSREEVR